MSRREAREKRRRRVRKKIFGTEVRPRLSVCKSNRHIYAQVIDDTTGTTRVFVSSLVDSKEKGVSHKSVSVARELGKALASEMKDKGIGRVTLDRGGYPYHGRIKAMTEALRKEGIVI